MNRIREHFSAIDHAHTDYAFAAIMRCMMQERISHRQAVVLTNISNRAAMKLAEWNIPRNQWGRVWVECEGK